MRDEYKKIRTAVGLVYHLRNAVGKAGGIISQAPYFSFTINVKHCKIVKVLAFRAAGGGIVEESE
jgi:hypothetical protein